MSGTPPPGSSDRPASSTRRNSMADNGDFLAPPSQGQGRSRSGSSTSKASRAETDPGLSPIEPSLVEQDDDHSVPFSEIPMRAMPIINMSAKFAVKADMLSSMTFVHSDKPNSGFYALGGLKGLFSLVRSSPENGLSSSEDQLDDLPNTDLNALTGHRNIDYSVDRSLNDQLANDPKCLAAKAAYEAVPRWRFSKKRTAHKAYKKEQDRIDRLNALRKVQPSTVAQMGKGFSDRIHAFSDNRIKTREKVSLGNLIWDEFKDPIVRILCVAAVVSLVIGLVQSYAIKHEGGGHEAEWIEGVAIIAAVIIIVFAGAGNNFKQELEFRKIHDKDIGYAKIRRDGKDMEIDVRDLLVGDIVHFSAGTILPADGVMISGENVVIDESNTTGESTAMKKIDGYTFYDMVETGTVPKNTSAIVFAETAVKTGSGSFLVTATGIYSSTGLTKMPPEEGKTPLQKKLKQLADYITNTAGAIGGILFVVLLIKFLVSLKNDGRDGTERGQEFVQILIACITLIVVAVPEGLPLAVTLALAFAMTKLTKLNNLVRKMQSCEIMGNVHTIVSDKTGTLTRGVMTVSYGYFSDQLEFSPNKEPKQSETTQKWKDLILELILFASDGKEDENPEEEKKEVGGVFHSNQTDTACLKFCRLQLGMADTLANARKTHGVPAQPRFPFDSAVKFMGGLKKFPDGSRRLYIKGASEMVLTRCSHRLDGKFASVPMKDEYRDGMVGRIEQWNGRSLRTIAMGYIDLETKDTITETTKLDDLCMTDDKARVTWVGIIGILDPLRDGVEHSIGVFHHGGVEIVMATGDNLLTAIAIASDAGIIKKDDPDLDKKVMTGSAFQKLSKEEKFERAPMIRVMARCAPVDKQTLVKFLNDNGRHVAVTGDGTNDVPALSAADIGFAMGSGTDAAKEAAGITLLDDNFNSIEHAFRWGRAVNEAVKKFLQFQLTVNVTAVLLTFVTAVASEDRKPALTAVQLLWINLIMDTLAALALASDEPAQSLMDRKPEKKGAFVITPAMGKMIIFQTIYQLIIVFVFFFGYEKMSLFDEADEQARVHSFIFNTFVFMQVFNLLNCRNADNRLNFLERIYKNAYFLVIFALICGLQVILIFFGESFMETVRLTGLEWGLSIAIGFCSIIVGAVARLCFFVDPAIERLFKWFSRVFARNKEADPEKGAVEPANPLAEQGRTLGRTRTLPIPGANMIDVTTGGRPWNPRSP